MSIPIVKVPKFKMTLPFSKKIVEYRPYVVKEEKLLIMAGESDNVEAAIEVVGEIVKECTNGAIDMNTDPMFDVQFAFLNIRGKSQGESIDLHASCVNCKSKNFISITAEDFKLFQTPGHSNKIVVEPDLKVVMKYPTFKNFSDLIASEDNPSLVFDIIARCIESIHTEEEVFNQENSSLEDFSNFLNEITPNQLEKLEHFFTTMPILQCKMDYVCMNCRESNTILIDGINNFFE